MRQTNRSLSSEYEVTAARQPSQVGRNLEQNQYLVFPQNSDGLVVSLMAQSRCNKGEGRYPVKRRARLEVSDIGYLACTNYRLQMSL